MSHNLWLSSHIQEWGMKKPISGISQLGDFTAGWFGMELTFLLRNPKYQSLEVFSRGFTFSRKASSEIPPVGGARDRGMRLAPALVEKVGLVRAGGPPVEVYTCLKSCYRSWSSAHSDLCLILNFCSNSCHQSQTSLGFFKDRGGEARVNRKARNLW